MQLSQKQRKYGIKRKLENLQSLNRYQKRRRHRRRQRGNHHRLIQPVKNQRERFYFFIHFAFNGFDWFHSKPHRQSSSSTTSPSFCWLNEGALKKKISQIHNVMLQNWRRSFCVFLVSFLPSKFFLLPSTLDVCRWQWYAEVRTPTHIVNRDRDTYDSSKIDLILDLFAFDVCIIRRRVRCACERTDVWIELPVKYFLCIFFVVFVCFVMWAHKNKSNFSFCFVVRLRLHSLSFPLK